MNCLMVVILYYKIISINPPFVSSTFTVQGPIADLFQYANFYLCCSR